MTERELIAAYEQLQLQLNRESNRADKNFVDYELQRAEYLKVVDDSSKSIISLCDKIFEMRNKIDRLLCNENLALKEALEWKGKCNDRDAIIAQNTLGLNECYEIINGYSSDIHFLKAKLEEQQSKSIFETFLGKVFK